MGKKKKISKEDMKKSQRDLLVWTVGICIVVVLIIGGIAYRTTDFLHKSKTNTSDKKAKETVNTMVQLETSKGNIMLKLEDSKMPITVTNFLKLVNENFYNGLTFHRVEDWVIQGGDPNGNGTGGSKDTIKLETDASLSNVRGALAMARRGEDINSATSQFYILKKDMTSLDGQYAVFGSIVSGMDIVDKMEIGDKIISAKIVK